MPFVSQAQRRWMYANKPSMAKEWEAHTPKGAKLPNKVKESGFQFSMSAPHFIRPHLSKLLGTQLFFHGTHEKNAPTILQQGLDPARGGTGASVSSFADPSKGYEESSRGKVHVTTDPWLGKTYAGIVGGSKGTTIGGAMPTSVFSKMFESDPAHTTGQEAFRGAQTVPRQYLTAGYPSYRDIWKNRDPQFLQNIAEKIKGYTKKTASSEKVAESAVGIPNREVYGDHTKLQPGQLVDFVIQEHKAERAGTHLDVRFGNSDTGLFSWATKKGVPAPAETRLWIRQPLHEHSYKSFQGEIKEGYGKGKVRTLESGKALITHVSPNTIHFTLAHRKFPSRYKLYKAPIGRDTSWFIKNVTPTEPIKYQKVHYKSISPEAAEKVLSNLQPGSHVQAKIDGAASLVKLTKDSLDVASYRTAKETGHPIVHTERVFGTIPKLKMPRHLEGTILRGELYGVTKGKVIPPQELGGILNSSIHKAINTQKEKGIKLENLIFDIHRYGHKPTKDLPYERRLELVSEVLGHLPSERFHSPPRVTTSTEALRLLRTIKEGKHPLTREGIVIHHETGKPIKAKFVEENDVHITGFFPGTGRLANSVGGFTYALTPGGKTVGKVGTGFSDKLREDMASNPKSYVGRVARIHAQEQHQSGAYRSPALIALHEDYPMKKTSSSELLLCAKIASAYNTRMEKTALTRYEKEIATLTLRKFVRSGSNP